MDFLDACTIYPKSSIDGDQDITYSASFVSKCNIHYEYENDPAGNNVLINAWVALPPKTSISSQDKIVLPDNVIPNILSVERIRSLATHRETYVRVELGRIGGL